MIDLTSGLISVPEILAAVADPSAGAIDVFIGATRNNSEGKKVLCLEYEAYVPMAMKMMEQIAADAKAKWDVKKIAMVHRLGRVNVGEPSIVIAVSAAHRAEAFTACRYIIDTLKQDAPIWKKEVENSSSG